MKLRNMEHEINGLPASEVGEADELLAKGVDELADYANRLMDIVETQGKAIKELKDLLGSFGLTLHGADSPIRNPDSWTECPHCHLIHDPKLTRCMIPGSS